MFEQKFSTTSSAKYARIGSRDADNKKIFEISGIALLSVMIVVVAVSATTSWLLYSQNLDITRMTRAFSKEQAILFTLSFEEIAKEILQQDFSEQGTKYDYYVERTTTGRKVVGQSWSEPNQWHRVMRPLLNQLLNQGLEEITLCIYDLQGLINVNSLARPGGVNPPESEKKQKEEQNDKEEIGTPERIAVDDGDLIIDDDDIEEEDFFNVEAGNPRPYAAWYRERLKQHLLQLKERREAINLEQSHIETLLDSLQDWLDEDENPHPQGAESSEYSFEEPPYQSANNLISSINELYLIHGFTDLPLSSRETELGHEVGMNDVLRNLVALPLLQTTINVNTASRDVLQTLPYLREGSLWDELYKQVQEQPFRDRGQIDAFLERQGLAEHERYWAEWYLGVNSSFFSVYIGLTIANHQIQTQSLLYRYLSDQQQPKIDVIDRQSVARDPYHFINDTANNCYTG